jgi:hypothetical protein
MMEVALDIQDGNLKERLNKSGILNRKRGD